MPRKGAKDTAIRALSRRLAGQFAARQDVRKRQPKTANLPIGPPASTHMAGGDRCMAAFAPVTDSELAQARNDPAFRQKLLEQNLEVLLAGLQKLRGRAPAQGSAGARQMREAVELAVRLAELIQGPATRARTRR
jgi:hypothetical protein